MSRIRSTCCPRAAIGHAAAAAIPLMKLRRRIACPLGSGPRRLRRDYSKDLRSAKWGSDVRFAEQQFCGSRCRKGSLSADSGYQGHVGYSPVSDLLGRSNAELGHVYWCALPVRERHGDATVWEGVVHVFDLTDHPKATRACPFYSEAYPALAK